MNSKEMKYVFPNVKNDINENGLFYLSAHYRYKKSDGKYYLGNLTYEVPEHFTQIGAIKNFYSVVYKHIINITELSSKSILDENQEDEVTRLESLDN